jgi:peptidase M23-like protein
MRAFLLSWIVLSLTAQAQPDRFTAVARRMVAAYNAQQHEAIGQDFGPVMRKAFPVAKSKPFFMAMMAKYGKITKLGPARHTPPMIALMPAHFERGVLDIKLVLDPQDKIIGLWFLAHTADIPAPKRNTAPLRLPFTGQWLTLWGGDTPEQNHHHPVPSQRHAFDFLIHDKDGKSFRGEGDRNEDYYCFGKPILAPADGVVTDVIRGVRDNKPRSMNPYSAVGNAVLIQHAKHEVSVLAHFKFRSIQVQVGQRVKAGQVLGACGNSGNSSEAHLHYHLMNTPVMQDGTGVKCFFARMTVTRDGEAQLKDGYSPVKGDRVAPK